MFRRGTDSQSGNSRGTRRRQRLLMGALGLVAVVWAMPLRVGVVQGGSMDPTLHSGQLLAVDRAYYRRNPLTVGDVVLFRGDHGVYVKRIHAVGGETVHLIEQGEGEDVERTPVARGAEKRIAARLAGAENTRLRRVPVPAGTFFALGDAIRNSEDSRDFGPVAEERIMGRVLPLGVSLKAPKIEINDVETIRYAGRLIGLAML